MLHRMFHLEGSRIREVLNLIFRIDFDDVIEANVSDEQVGLAVR